MAKMNSRGLPDLSLLPSRFIRSQARFGGVKDEFIAMVRFAFKVDDKRPLDLIRKSVYSSATQHDIQTVDA